MQKAKKRSIVLLSGGLDSAANLAFAAVRRDRGEDDPILALTMNYGQRAAAREIAHARKLCDHFEVRHEVVNLEWLGKLGGSSLTSQSVDVPLLRSDQLDDRKITESSAAAVWVPNRNGALINVAAAFAESEGADQVLVGFNREEAATFPDNSQDFMDRATRALALSTRNGVQVASYTVALDKREIAAKLRAEVLEFPFGLVWSCYFGGEAPCGRCESCQRFIRATTLPVAGGIR